jgi:hypothetical protein
MAWQVVTYHLTSSAPLLMHNGQTADPTNRWSKAMKAISSKRAKTDADYAELAHIEFLAGLYLTADGPVLPPNMISSMLVAAAKKVKEGQSAKSGVFCLDPIQLAYIGPRTPEELWANDEFHFAAIVRIGTNRVSRMRPIFKVWSADVILHMEDTLVNGARVDEWMRIAGTQIGLGDWRPQYGRFVSKRISSAK